MPALAEQFVDAKSNVEPDADDVKNASSAHKKVRGALETSATLRDSGIDTILIGSYARHVSIHRMRDVDVFSKLPELDDETQPDDLLTTFEETLEEEFGVDRVTRQERSIKVEFPDFDLSVDAVPARPKNDHWEIPDGSGGWQETDPIQLGELCSEMNAECDNHYVPTVKLIRQVRRAQLGDAQPGGFYIEIATYHAFADGIDESDTSGFFVGALEGVADQLADAVESGLPDPALPGHLIRTRASDAELERAAEVFAEIARRARESLESEDACAAAKTFQEILGKNTDEEWVFPMPSYCNEDGTAKSSTEGLAAGSSVIRGGDSRYA